MDLRRYRTEDLPALSRLFGETVRRVNIRDYTPAQAASKGSWGRRSKMLMSRAAPERTRQVTSFFTPPHSRNRSRAWITETTSFLIPIGV